MHFIDDIYFVFAFGGSNIGFFAQVANIVDAGIAGGIDFDDVDVIVFKFILKTIYFVG